MSNSKVYLCLHNLHIEVESDHNYPDQLVDMTNRALHLMIGAINVAKENNIDIRDLDIEDIIEDED